jgi:hypothetical protein
LPIRMKKDNKEPTYDLLIYNMVYGVNKPVCLGCHSNSAL